MSSSTSSPSSPIALTLTNACHHLAAHVDELLTWQIVDWDHRERGAIVSAEYGCADNKLTSHFVTAAVYLWLATLADGAPPVDLSPLDDGSDLPFHDRLLARTVLAADYLLAAQRPSGNIDLLSVNYDSSPDTGFTVQQLCTVFELGKDRLMAHRFGRDLLARLETFIRRAVTGMLDGGFHTPNHRWVIVSALVQARAIFPDLDVTRTVDAYLAEGIDIDDEGCFIERSVGVYDAVNNRSLLFIAEANVCADALPAVQRSLDFDLYLLHADGSAETGLSRRQDYGTREVALGLAACYLHANHLAPDPRFVEAACRLWTQSLQPVTHLLWTVYALLRFGDPIPTGAQLPTRYSRIFPQNGIWRVRQERLSASFFKDTTRLLSLVHGQAELTALKISLTYFGSYCGRFFGDELTVDGDHGVLLNRGLRRPRRPGYELPLGRPVAPDDWDASFAERPLRQLPPLTAELHVDAVDGGFDLRYHLLDGLDGVAAQIAFDFAPGGIWETADTRTKPTAGQVIFLKNGYGEMRYGSDAIRIGPGAVSHGMWQMRDAETAPEHVRVLFTFWTPVEHVFEIRAYRG
ncbi:MAG: hypothetical protein KDD84_19485, partial [Caldilineaceae bacterium]|nr:hypothetical protein [Caldilineaceae bacterium]